jgi:hypothetical protein
MSVPALAAPSRRKPASPFAVERWGRYTIVVFSMGVDMPAYHGGCLCGAIRYAASAEPIRVVYCHCKFCQRATGSAYMVEPIFERTSFEVTAGKPATFTQASGGSGKRVAVNFCAACGTKLYLDLKRFPTIYGVYGGTFDDPNWFDRSSKMARHIFLDSAQRGTIIPAGVKTFRQHTMLDDGAPALATVFDGHHLI